MNSYINTQKSESNMIREFKKKFGSGGIPMGPTEYIKKQKTSSQNYDDPN